MGQEPGRVMRPQVKPITESKRIEREERWGGREDWVKAF